MNFWPGTNIPKSKNNAFTDWKKATDSLITRDKSFKISQMGKQNALSPAKVNITFKKQR